jgi:uncharacterized lipoprotein YajG
MADTFKIKEKLIIKNAINIASDNVNILEGTGSPESNITASPSSIFLDRSNGKSYIKKTGIGNTGWQELIENSNFQTQLATKASLTHIHSIIKDADSDTKIDVEESADNDILKLYTANNLRMLIGATGSFDIDSNAFDLDATGNITIKTISGIITLQADVNKALLTSQPSGSVDLAIATTKYVKDNSTPKYTCSIKTSGGTFAWSGSPGSYNATIPVATHGLTVTAGWELRITCYQKDGNNDYNEVVPSITRIKANGDVYIEMPINSDLYVVIL